MPATVQQQRLLQDDVETITVHLRMSTLSFRYASPCLWNQLPLALRQPHSGTSSSIPDSPIPSPITAYSSDSALCSSTTTSLLILFHSRLKTYLFHKSYPP